MTNRFYNESFSVSVGSRATSSSVDLQLQAIEDGFDLLQSEVDALTLNGEITGLGGFPSSFAGAALKLLRVNAAESALEFVAPGTIGIKTIAGTAYTLEAADAGQMLVFTNAAAVTVTVPPASSVPFDLGAALILTQYGYGRVSVIGGVGVTINSTDGLVSTRTQFAQITIIKTGADAWLVGGDRA